MSQQRLQQFEFDQFVSGIVSSWRKSQLKVLALCVQALVLRRCCTLSALARALPATTAVHYRLKRLARFMDNRRLDLLVGWKALAQRGAQLQPEGWLPVLVDETGLRDHATLLTAAIPWHGRALPVAAVAYSPASLKRSIWALRQGLIWCLHQGLGLQAPRMVVVADRAFAASHCFRWLGQQHIHFVVRVPAKVYVQWSGWKALLSSLDLRPGRRQWLPDLRYGPRHATLNLLVVWRRDCAQPWLLATSLEDPKEVLRLYRLRMRIEAFFKDSKGRFALESCRLRTGARISTFCFALLLAFWWLALCLPLPPDWEIQVRIRGKLSWLSLALERLDGLLTELLLDHLADTLTPPQELHQSG